MSKLHAFTDSNFQSEVLDASEPVLVDFWATWCIPCKLVVPHLEALAEAYVGKAKIGKLNVDESQQIAQQYGVMSIPTLLVFKGGQVVGQTVGAANKAALEKLLQSAL